MSVTSGFFNSLSGDRKYDAIQISSMFDGLITDGIYNGFMKAFMVTASEPASMVVTVGEGRAWFNHTWTLNDAPLPLTIEASDVVLNRIDTVVIDVDSTDTTRACTVKVVKGTASSQAVPPTLVNAEMHHQYPLCDISIPAAAKSITQAQIKNRRGTSDCPFVATLMKSVSVDDLLAQWEAQWDEWMQSRMTAMDQWTNEQKEAFNTWFQSVQDILDSNAAGNLLNRINHRTGVNATATYDAGVVKIVAPDDAGEVLTFVAPSDFLASDTYTVNAQTVTLTDLNGEAVDDAWKKDSIVTISVSGGKAFFKTGGGGKNDTLPPLLGNMTVKVSEGSSEDTYTIKMDKLVLDKTTQMVAGAQLEWGEEMPAKPGKGANIKKWSREEIVTTGKPYDGLYLGDVTASDAVNEVLLWLPEKIGGKTVLSPFIILSTDYLGGVYVDRLNIITSGPSWFLYQSDVYEGSPHDDWYQETYLNSILDSSISSQILEVDLPSGAGTIKRKAFSPSYTELYNLAGDGAWPTEGKTMPYFTGSGRTKATNDSGVATGYATRTVRKGNTQIGFVDTNGNITTPTSANGYMRPAFVLPKDFQIQQRPDGSYTVWNEMGLMKLKDIDVSSESTEVLVHISEKTNGAPIPYLYLSSKYSGSGNMLLRKEAFKNPVTSGTYVYTSSTMNTEIQNWTNGFSQKLKELLAPVEISFRIGSSGVEVRSATMSAFLLSSLEFGEPYSWYPVEKIPYFNNNERRKCKIEGANTYVAWYSRDVSIYNSSKYWWYGCVKEDGNPNYDVRQDASAYIRPAITITASSPIRQLADGSYDLVPEDPALSPKKTKAPEVPVEPPKGTPIQLKDIPVSNASLKRTLLLPEEKGEQPYIYLSSNYNGSGRGMMLREFTLPSGTDFSAFGVWRYDNSIVFQKIADWFDTLPSSLKQWIEPISVYFRYATGYTSSDKFVSGVVEAPAFPLTYNNMSTNKGDATYYGETLPYFASDGRRKAFIEGTETAVSYWLTDINDKYDAISRGVYVYQVTSAGTISRVDFRNNHSYIRPAITLSPDVWFLDNGDGTYTFVGDKPVDDSPAITYTVTVPHGQKVVFRQFTQNDKKQFQTMLVGGVYPPLVEEPSGPVYSEVLAENTWEQIAQACADDDPILDKWQVGDTKDESINGETLTFAIMGKNMDDLADGSGKAHLTFGMTQLMAAQRQMNGSNTNAGSFAGSAMYSWLSGSVYSGLNSELKKAIKAVNKKTSAGNNSSSIRTDAMYLWLFSEVEVFGITTQSYAGEGLKYPYFATASERIKKLSNGTGAVSYWWERSPYRNGSFGFCYVNTSGSADPAAANSSRGVCFGFCI